MLLLPFPLFHSSFSLSFSLFRHCFSATFLHSHDSAIHLSPSPHRRPAYFLSQRGVFGFVFFFPFLLSDRFFLFLILFSLHFVLQKVISAYSARFRRISKQHRRARRRTTTTTAFGASSSDDFSNSAIEIDDFPGGVNGFELISRFCYNRAQIDITVSNVALLHCCAVFLGMTEEVAAGNLILQTENFLDGIFYWSWSDILLCLRSCESFFAFADSSGLLQKLVCALLAKIAQNSNASLVTPSSSSSSSSPDNASGNSRLSTKLWWFDDMSLLPARIIEKVVQGMGSYGSSNNSLILTRFLLHYLKTAAQSTVGYVLH